MFSKELANEGLGYYNEYNPNEELHLKKMIEIKDKNIEDLLN